MVWLHRKEPLWLEVGAQTFPRCQHRSPTMGVNYVQADQLRPRDMHRSITELPWKSVAESPPCKAGISFDP